MSKITDIHSREILDSRGNPTIEATVTLDNSLTGTASVPSGASTGTHEAFELRDNDPKRFNGKGVLKAIENVHTKIKAALTGKDPTNQIEIDRIMIELDGTENKSNLGANAILSVSLACCRAAAITKNVPLYQYLHEDLLQMPVQQSSVTPMFNVINGGLHGGGNLEVQEFMLVPEPKKPFHEKLRIGAELFHRLKAKLHHNGLSVAVGDEGGFASRLESNETALDLLKEIISNSGFRYGTDVSISLDLASSTFYKNNDYWVQGGTMKQSEWISYLIELNQKYRFLSLEDPLSEDDWEGWTKFMTVIARTPLSGGTKQSRLDSEITTGSPRFACDDKKLLIVGDDLLVTNKKRLQKAIELKACNSILIKVNQIGTLTETLEVVRLAKKAAFSVIISHRSAETNDDFIADLAVAVGADFVKFGAPARGERVAKYNRLLQIYKK